VARTTPKPFDLVGLIALLLSGTALLGTSIPSLSGFVVPLGVLGLLTGLVGVAQGKAAGRPSPLSAAVGAAVGGTVLFVVLLSPGPSRDSRGAAPPNPGAGPVGPPPVRPQAGMPLDPQ
jgi:hypothetical protein